MSQLDNAREMLRRGAAVGLKIFPCHPRSKKPATAHGSLDATNDVARIDAYWAKNPEANPGVCGGTIVDVDEGINSLDEAFDFADRHGFTETLVVRTGRRPGFGVQFHYSGPSVSGPYSIDGVSGEVRSGNLYGMAPGSIHPNGNVYEIIVDKPIAPAPPNLLAEAIKSRRESNAKKVEQGEKISHPGRHDWLVAQAGRLFNTGLTGDALFNALSALDQRYCSPPKGPEHVREIVQAADKDWERAPIASKPETPAEKITGDERREFLALVAENFLADGGDDWDISGNQLDYVTASAEEHLFRTLIAVNQQECKPPLPDSVVRAVSVEVYERATGRKIEKYPGLFESVIQNETDVAYGKYFIGYSGKFVRYNTESGEWLVWDAKQSAWHIDDEDVLVTGLFKDMWIVIEQDFNRVRMDTLPQYLAIQAKIDADEKYVPTAEEREIIRAYEHCEKMINVARGGQLAKQIAHALKMAQSETGIATPTGLWDANPLVLNLPNATLDLDGGGAIVDRRQQYCLLMAGVDYDPEATCPRFIEVLTRSIPEKDRRDFLQDFYGISLTGLSIPEILIYLGEGANGKGVLNRIAKGVLGSYYHKAAMSSFLQAKFANPGGARSDLSNLRGRRLVAASEANRRNPIDLELLKDWTGGENFTARDIYQRAKKGEFKPQGKLVLSMNHPPKVDDTTHAAWRRLRYIKFKVIIPVAEQDEKLADELLASEGPGILNWMLEGWSRARKRIHKGQPALLTPESILNDTNEYRLKENQAARFFEDAFKVDPKGALTSIAVYTRYKIWCEANGEMPMRDQILIMELTRYCSERKYKVDFGAHNHHAGIHKGLAIKTRTSESPKPAPQEEPIEMPEEETPF